MEMTSFKLYPTIKDRALEELLKTELGEDFDEIASMLDPEFHNDTFINFLFKDHRNQLIQEEPGEGDYEGYDEDVEQTRKMNLARKFLFNLFGDKYDRVLVDVSW